MKAPHYHRANTFDTMNLVNEDKSEFDLELDKIRKEIGDTKSFNFNIATSTTIGTASAICITDGNYTSSEIKNDITSYDTFFGRLVEKKQTRKSIWVYLKTFIKFINPYKI
jgi:hypothetical protein